MKNILFLVVFLSALVANAQEIDRFAFGSCSFQFTKQNIWKSVVSKKPQLWVWLGDIVYGDIGNSGKSLAERYAMMQANPNYNLLKEACPTIGTWDDHDFGANNVGKDFPQKEESRKIFLDFFGAKDDDPRWKRQGIYNSFEYGSGDRKVKFILLDTRFNREDPGAETDMLGEEQWRWLEDELKNSDAKINVIGSSIQFVAEVPSFENWAKFPKSHERMIKLIGETGVKGVVFLSGDVHFTETSKRKYDQISYPIYDFTSSGLTHGNNVMGLNQNPYRLGKSRYGRHNFGFVEFDWEGQKLTFTEFSQHGKQKYRQEVPFSEIGW